ncbi:MAG: type IV secretory system conjugative DNA transfer family protein [Vicinamibacteraceae bacterium]
MVRSARHHLRNLGVVLHRGAAGALEMRVSVSLVVANIMGYQILQTYAWPARDPVLGYVTLVRPDLAYGGELLYHVLCFSSPFLVTYAALSWVHIWLVPPPTRVRIGRLPPYPQTSDRDDLCLVVGELHHPTKPIPVATPRWLTIPRRGLCTGIAVFGAVGTGKTSGCMYPFAQQLLTWRAQDPHRKLSGLILEVKGDFCYHARRILADAGRDGDYVELNLAGQWRYNPLHNELDAYSLAYTLTALLQNLFGKSTDAFWAQATTNLLKFLILLHRATSDYVTLVDLYHCAIDRQLLESRIAHARATHLAHPPNGATPEAPLVIIDTRIYADPRYTALMAATWTFRRDGRTCSTAATDSLLRLIDELDVPHTISRGPDPRFAQRQRAIEAVERWFHHDWLQLHERLRTAIVENVTVFLSLFDSDADVNYVFCPEQACYDADVNADGHLGRPLPPWQELLEQGKVLALNMPMSANPGLSRVIGTMLKLDFQRAVLNRIPRMAAHPERSWRDVLFLCDEYQAFATAGAENPIGDDKAFALSRQARLIPIVATQSVSSLVSVLPADTWRTVAQTFRTKLFLTLSDDMSAKYAAELCGRTPQLWPTYSLGETAHDAHVSLLTGHAGGDKASLSTTKSYGVRLEHAFEPRVFTQLRNAQAVALAYDGINPWPPTLCYLKPYYLDRRVSYFQHLAEGSL